MFLQEKNKFNIFKNYKSAKQFEDFQIYDIVYVDKDKKCHGWSSLKSIDKSNTYEYYISNLDISKNKSYLKTGLVKVSEDNSELDIEKIKKDCEDRMKFYNKNDKFGVVTGIIKTDSLEILNENSLKIGCFYSSNSNYSLITSKELCIPVYLRVVLLN